MSQGSLYATARRLTLSAAVVAAAAACTTKTDAPATPGGPAPGSNASAAPANAGANGAPAAGADSASGAVVTHSAPPTVQDRQVAVPAGGRTADTNHSGMAVSRGAPKRPR